MIMPAARAAAATGAGGAPTVVAPSVKSTMTFPLAEEGSKSAMALEKASAWLVPPPAVRPSTADFRVAVSVMRGTLAVAVLAKLTTAMRLPEPIWPSTVLSVDWSMMSIKVLAPSFIS